MSLFDSSNKGVKFETVGAEIIGTITSTPTERQQTKFGTQEPDFWPNGDPKMQIVVNLQTALREDPNDTGERTLYVASKHMKRAIGEAIRAANVSDVAKGGVLTVKYIGNDPASKNPANPAKMYAAAYTPPTSAFTTPTAPQVAPAAPQQPAQAPAAPQPVQYQQPAAQPVQQAPFATPAAVQAPAPGGLTEQQAAQLQQLRSAGIPAETIQQAMAAVGVTAQQIAAYDNTPF